MTETTTQWTLDDVGDQTGRTFLVTGVTSGLGFETAAVLAQRNARVVLAARSRTKLDETVGRLKALAPEATLEELVVDLSDQASIRHAAHVAKGLGAIDVLVNNAGVMATPNHRTVDGLDLQMATNHFGPFLLTGLLLPQLLESGNARVVTVSSLMHRHAQRPPLHEPRQPPGHYRRWRVYGESKLANLLFTFELDRRAQTRGLPLKALAAHPGYSATHLIATGQTGSGSGALASIFNGFARATAQPADMGALPTLMAATADLPGSTYVGPGGFQETRGLPTVVRARKMAYDVEAQRRLWEISEHVVGLRWP